MNHDDAIAISPPAPSTEREPLFVPRAMTTVVVAALGVCVLVNAALLIAQLRFLRAADGSYAAVQREMWVGTFTGMRLLAFLVTGIVFLRWLWQMRVNAEALAPRGHRMKRGWTTGAWLVPVACFFLPKRIINDIWAASSPPDRPRRTEALLTSWWLLFVAAQLLAFPSTSRGPLSAEMAGAALYVLAGVLGIGVVRRLAAMQRVRLHG
ncbi:DUF4328 domain-containing protein [Streptomyces sp. AM2-3-1]|uniref:DUF4328 domain-containing protein n=1 Tax=unclassified Streptomyces TaxID=2593676 RepID=UPI0028C4B1BA|nr:DUF4328 domain-containing protein [Streptomyces sp. AM2-3-1]WNO68615.1 DUF4328 domain-containing protein [Streptomyces sp. AM2-3-1]WTE63705.1 DUF4328 domain-containing protein [Streptomyces sp. NBC_01617]WTI90991.1 DUF4328 domain-containing protein [Streptomyces sp. NBC_00724]